jgi:ribonuclease T1
MKSHFYRWFRLLLIAGLLLPLAAGARSDASAATEIAIAALPAEAQHTIQLIQRGGPFPFQRDGVAFGNYERRLPLQPRGYYREFTVPTPGTTNRGARRIIAGHDGEYYYTADHYRSFRRVRV